MGHVGVAYAIEKLDVAVDALPASASSIQDRLFNAYISALMRVKPEDDLPEELRARSITVSDRLTCVEARTGEGTLRATLEVLADDGAVAIAQEVVDLWRELHVDRID